MTTGRTGGARGSVVAGWIAAVGLAVLYGVLVSRTEFGRAEAEIFSDEATYYLMAHSLASDGDLAYRREDLLRMLREFRSGPRGVFLKRGTTIGGEADPDPTRLFFGKSFIYPLSAWPFVRILGTNGFLVFNLVLLALAFGCAYQFLAARSGTAVSLLLAFSFIFATAVPVYVVWMMPELFNFTLGVVAYFLWLFKEVSPAARAIRRRWLRGPASDIAAAVLFGLAAFSKLTNVIMAGPMLAWLLWRGQWKRAIAAGTTVGLVTAALFAVNIAVSGEWNYQGGNARATCYGPYPFQQPGQGLEVCDVRGRDETLTNVLFDPEVFWTNLIANVQYFVIGRNAGLLPYFFPLVFATIAFLLARGRRAPWQWIVLGGLVAHIGVQLILWPYTYYGSGGTVANRYFMGAYGASVFLFPPIRSIVVSAIPVVIGGVFVANMVLDPFATSARPGRYSMTGLQRRLPVELTQVNDLPINTETARVRLWYGDTGAGDIGFQIYYLDDNSYLAEADKKTFWTRGESRAEFLIKTDRPCRRFQVVLTAGPVATTATVNVEGRKQTVRLEPGTSQQLSFNLPPGFPYKKDRDKPAMVWVVSISSTAGFTPAPSPANDTRHLGVLVKPMVFE